MNQVLLQVKHAAWGGIHGRKEATGYGTIYFTEEMLKNHHTDIKGKVITVKWIWSGIIRCCAKSSRNGC